MKDAYSFDVDEEGAEESYEKMFDAYNRIFQRCGLHFRAVEADSGSIGGSYSHEFMVTADTGEDAMVFCSDCQYAANIEKAEVAMPEKVVIEESEYATREEVYTPDVRTIEEVCDFLDVKPRDVVKTLIFLCDDRPVAALVRGDEEINEIKLKNYLACDAIELATEDIIREVTNSPRGFAGPIGIRCDVIADYSLINMKNFVVGGNKENYHIKGCNIGRDVKIKNFADVRLMKDADTCPRCGGTIHFARGIEVGHVFKLGTKYSKAMNATFLDKDGTEKYMIMGCYGIGIGRTVAACIEQSNDKDGIVWPMPIAPYQVIITPVNMKDEQLSKAAEDIYRKLDDRGVEVILDDRNERAGVKFKDADLIGIPLRITIGSKSFTEGKVEIKSRQTGEIEAVPVEGTEDFICKKIKEELVR
jgi:prolyl-tRNA synthetase